MTCPISRVLALKYFTEATHTLAQFMCTHAGALYGRHPRCDAFRQSNGMCHVLARMPNAKDNMLCFYQGVLCEFFGGVPVSFVILLYLRRSLILSNHESMLLAYFVLNSFIPFNDCILFVADQQYAFATTNQSFQALAIAYTTLTL